MLHILQSEAKSARLERRSFAQDSIQSAGVSNKYVPICALLTIWGTSGQNDMQHRRDTLESETVFRKDFVSPKM